MTQKVEVGDVVEDSFTGNLCTVTNMTTLKDDVGTNVYVDLTHIHADDMGMGTRHVADVKKV